MVGDRINPPAAAIPAMPCYCYQRILSCCCYHCNCCII